MKPKVLIIILVVIAVLFVVGMALGARGGGTPNLADARAQIERLFGKLAAGSALEAGDVINTSSSGAANCANLLTENGQATISNNGFCRFNVRAEERAVRSLSLLLNQGSAGRFRTDNHTPEVNLEITLNQCKQVQIMEDGGLLTVSCGPSAQPCVFRATQCP